MSFKLAVLACMAAITLTSARPQNGYNLPRPPPPTNLYERPQQQQPPRPRPTPPPAPPASYGAPSNQSPSNVRPPQQQQPQMEGMPYDFDWGVADEESGNSFSHVETSDGQTTRGEYRVLLPDGRTQVVTFFDDGNGYNAEVTYE